MINNSTHSNSITPPLLHNYFKNLINSFFKILPMKENSEETLITYMQSLKAELLGCQEIVASIKNDAAFLTLLSILQYLISTPECSVREVKREVFKAISICNNLKSRYALSEVIT